MLFLHLFCLNLGDESMIKPHGINPIARQVSVCVVGSIVFLWAGATAVQSRPVADDTLGNERTIVTPEANIRGLPGDRIQGGARRGNNLFHSFRDFQVDAGRSVYFVDPGVNNILARVTGGTRSDILGTLGVLGGNANLFLINPSGILFGQNARLDVGGSFVATTANAIGFGNQGFFDVADPAAPPLLTVQPSAFLFSQINPGAIENQSRASLGDDGLGNEVFGLLVPNGQNLVLLGGNVVNQGNLNAFGGRVELGSTGGLGTIGFETNGSLSFPNEITRADVRITDGSQIDVASDTRGDIVINARNIDISGESLLRAGIFSGLGTVDSQAGNVVLNGTREIQVRQSSLITNNIETDGIGRGGKINITTGSLFVTDRSQLQAITAGQGNAGSIIIEAADRVVFDNSIAFTTVGTDGIGNGGDINITAGLLFITNNAQLQSLTFGKGDAGNIIIYADDRVVFDDNSTAFSGIQPEAIGNGGDIRITTGLLSMSRNSVLTTTTIGQGNSGDINIQAHQISMSANAAMISDTNTGGRGQAGNINLDVDGVISLIGGEEIAPTGESTRITLGIQPRAGGSGGRIRINAGSLVLSDGAIVKASTQGEGNAGNIQIDAGVVSISGSVPSSGLPSGLFTSTDTGDRAGNIRINSDTFQISNGAALSARTRGSGQGGNIRVNTDTFEARNGGQLVTTTAGEGNAGNIFINADRITLSGRDSNYFERIANFPNPIDPLVANNITETGSSSGLFANVAQSATGNGGSINITTTTLSMEHGSALQTSYFGQSPTDNAHAGNIRVRADRLSLLSNASIETDTSGSGRAGNINLDVDGIISLIGGEIAPTGESTRITLGVQLGATGSGGNLRIHTHSLRLTDGAIFKTSTQGSGDAGNIRVDADRINISGSVPSSGLPSGFFASTDTTARAGNIKINSDIFQISDGASLSARTQRGGQGGNIRVETDAFEVLNGGQLVTTTTGEGNAGNIFVNANLVTLSGFDPNYSERTDRFPDPIDPLVANNITETGSSSGLFANTGENSSGSGGTIQITTGQLEVFDRARVVVSSQGSGIAGNIDMAAPLVELDRGRLTAETSQGDGGNITLQDSNLLLLRNRSRISTTAGTAKAGGDGGDINIDTAFIVAVPNKNSDIEANAFKGSGGNVTINTQGLFGIEPQDQTTDRSDITASSELGVQGNVNINTPDVDPSRGIIELPDLPLDASNQISQTCPTGGKLAEALGEFVNTGRGGLPANPTEILGGEVRLPRLAGLPIENTEQQSSGAANQTYIPQPPSPAIVEAQGWQINAEGKVNLVAAAPAIAPHLPASAAAQCGGSN